MRIAIIDNYDSFTYNLVHIVEPFCEQTFVMRNNHINWTRLELCDKIIFSPGPGLPVEVKAMGQIMDRYVGKKPILGVCLGMQYIGEYYGAKLVNLPEVMHGIPKPTIVVQTKEILFAGIPQAFSSGRYHSWVLSEFNFPDCLEITAIDDEKKIMAIRHREFDLCGVQFHPESILTQYGKKMLQNWIVS